MVLWPSAPLVRLNQLADCIFTRAIPHQFGLTRIGGQVDVLEKNAQSVGGMACPVGRIPVMVAWVNAAGA